MNTKKNKVLVLSGGGAFGSYQTGVLKALLEKNLEGWDIIAGVSVGAINALWLASFNKENIKDAIVSLETLWKTLIKGNKSIYQPWYFKPFNYIASFWKGSLYHTKPLFNLLKKNADLNNLNASDVSAYVGAVSLNSGLFSLVDIKHNEKALEWVLASASMPILFNPIEINAEKWVDGGVKSITPLKEIINQIGKDNIEHIDIILTNPTKLNKNTKKFNSIIELATECLEATINEIMNTDLDIEDFKGSYSIYKPETPLEFDAFDFNPKNLSEAIEKGYRETKIKIF
jgi:NTE family protein